MARSQEHIAVIGLGRFGSSVALELVRNGVEVLAVDNDPHLTQAMAGYIENIVTADATDRDALIEVGIGAYDCAVVGISENLQASALITLQLAELGVNTIWAKASSPEYETILRKVGATHIVRPEHEMGIRVAHQLESQTYDYTNIGGDWVIATTRPPQDMLGRVDRARIARLDVDVVGFRSSETSEFHHVTDSTSLSYSDQILIVGRSKAVNKFLRRV